MITVLLKTFGMQFDAVMISSSTWGKMRFISGRSNAFWKDVRLILSVLVVVKNFSPHRNRTSMRVRTIRRTVSWARHTKQTIWKYEAHEKSNIMSSFEALCHVSPNAVGRNNLPLQRHGSLPQTRLKSPESRLKSPLTGVRFIAPCIYRATCSL